MSEIVGVGFEIHITQMYHLTCCMALLKSLVWKRMSSCVGGGALLIDDCETLVDGEWGFSIEDE